MVKKAEIVQVEIMIQKPDGNLEWMVLAEAGEGKKIFTVQDRLIVEFKHERGLVQTTYNLNEFLGYSIVR